ncbi:hypothetical protein ABB07_15590 [Streptomyces incarnatus]|uniref:WXG100 family type VII secretion target n=1 Tax=Streptomyces incarnatus TaxID=665007 RepID=A0ABM5TKA6_9ACTN|nr:hypothetical protein [Streptomyces incarnatus]AKJ11401.1 hypothetical protein ABB07_15590 [Streptomyces incarnatus]
MPTYHEILTTDLSTLTTAAEHWDGVAKDFHTQETAYRRDVYGISMGPAWQGMSATVANGHFDVTLKEFQKARTEAKAIASLFRDAHTQFMDLRKKLESARDDAIAQGMKVSDQGVVSYDTGKLSPGDRQALAHDPDYQDSIRKSVASWQALIDQCVKNMDDADAGVAIAFQAVVIDSDTSDGTVNGFNGKAQGDIKKYDAEAAAAAKEARTKPDGWHAKGKTKLTGPDAGFSVTTDPKYGKEGSVKAYADLFHATADGTLTNGDLKLAGVVDGYGGARATANYGFNNKGVVGKAEASVGLRGLTEGRAEYGPYGSLYARADGFAGAEAGVNAKVTKDEVTVGGKAFAGAKGSVAGGGEVAGIGFGATAEGWAGPGAEAWWGYKKDDSGAYHLGGKAGVSPILGGSVGFEITVDPHKLSKTADAAADALGDAAEKVGEGFSSVTNVANWL